MDTVWLPRYESSPNVTGSFLLVDVKLYKVAIRIEYQVFPSQPQCKVAAVPGAMKEYRGHRLEYSAVGWMSRLPAVLLLADLLQQRNSGW